VQNQLGYIVLAQGEFAAARASFTESLLIYRELGSRGGIVEGLMAFSTLSAGEKHVERTVRLLGAAEQLRASLSTPLPKLERDECESRLTGARRQLGERAFLAAWEEGQSMTEAQAITYALEEAEA
jgi:hypothetical protein